MRIHVSPTGTSASARSQTLDLLVSKPRLYYRATQPLNKESVPQDYGLDLILYKPVDEMLNVL